MNLIKSAALKLWTLPQGMSPLAFLTLDEYDALEKLRLKSKTTTTVNKGK